MRIVGVGTAVPEFSFSQSEFTSASKHFCSVDDRRERLIRALYRRSGVQRRHSVLLEGAEGEAFARQSFYPETRGVDDGGPTTRERMEIYEREAPPLSLEAARRAIDDAQIDPDTFTHLITVSCTGFQAPGIDAMLIEELGLPRSVERTHVGFMGCHGALNGIRVASSFIRSHPEARVLLCAVELCTLHFFYGWDAEKIVANSLFADGAGALVGVADFAHGGGGTWRAAGSGTLLMPDSEDAMTWRIGDHGFHMTLSARVPKLIRAGITDWLEGWLEEHDLRIDDVATWAVHPGGPRILTAFGDAVGLSNGALSYSREILADYGNMSSATLIFILDRLRKVDAQRPCVAVGFGPGMVVETALLV